MTGRQTDSMQLSPLKKGSGVFLSGSGILRRPMRGKCIRIGRERGNDISPQGAGLSRFHAELRRTKKGWEVVDLGSKNGTFVAGARVTQALLPERAQLRFGGVVMLFEQVSGPEPEATTGLAGVIGSHPSMLALAKLVNRVAATNVPVVILGESGVGKELVAQALHRQSGRVGALVNVNCGAMSSELVSSQLFGHVRGAFTGADRDSTGAFEAARDGTLFLDEIGEMPMEVQVQMLRALESGQISRVGEVRERPVSARVICATHRDLDRAVATGRFREDLYHRLMVFPLVVPSLRERRSDILPLAEGFIEREAPGYFLSPEARQRLKDHLWTGNVRELRNCLRRAVILADGDEISAAQLGLLGNRPITGSLSQQGESLYATILAEDGNLSLAAKKSGLSRSTIYRRLEADGLARLSRVELIKRLRKRLA